MTRAPSEPFTRTLQTAGEFDPRDRADARQFPDKFVGGRWTYKTGDMSRIRFMARASGYVMVRKPGCMPFVLSEKEWARLRMYAASDPVEQEQGGLP